MICIKYLIFWNQNLLIWNIAKTLETLKHFACFKKFILLKTKNKTWLFQIWMVEDLKIFIILILDFRFSNFNWGFRCLLNAFWNLRWRFFHNLWFRLFNLFNCLLNLLFWLWDYDRLLDIIIQLLLLILIQFQLGS
jgi:hypothetical protein